MKTFITRKTLAMAVSITALIAMMYAGAYGRLGGPGNWGKPDYFLPDSPATGKADSTKLKYPIGGNKDNPYKKKSSNNLDLKTPEAVEKSVELDTSLKFYKKSYKVGDEDVSESEYIPSKEYVKNDTREWLSDYFKKRSQAQTIVSKQGEPILPKVTDKGILDAINKSTNGLVDIRPTGSAELIFAGDINRIANPNWSLREQRTSQFKFDQKLQFNVIGSIGNKIKLGISYNTESTFDFQNQKKINYVGQEDEIVKSFEIGDVNMSVSNSLISGSQSLFGVKSQLQFGKLFVTGIYAQSKSEKKEITVENGAQRNTFNITADNYDVNKHFFLGQFFKDHFNEFNKNYPALSNVVVTRVQVWITNKQGAVQNTRNMVGYMDLGENDPYNKKFISTWDPNNPFPDNNRNGLYKILTGNLNYRLNKTVTQELEKHKNNTDNFYSGQDYMKIENARQLNTSEFTFNPRLGYISLNSNLNPDDVLAVAYEYTVNGIRYQVGEFAQDVAPDASNPNVLHLKLLKSVTTRPDLPIWHLMMKNIYSLGAYQVQQTDFKLQIIYEDNRSGSYLNYIPEPDEPGLNGRPLIQVLGFDRFNSQIERKPDGNFDYLEGVTIVSNNGRIIFPVLEPFGKDLRSHFIDPTRANYYTYDSLYSSTRAVAIQQANKNKFYLRGTYQGASGNEISLNAINVPQGSVKVFAGGQELRENVDYTVDYSLGRVKIINSSISNSGSVIRVQLESNTLFSIQQKTLMGTRAEYKFSKNFNLASTFLYLRERPLTPKVTLGDEPIRNAIWGLDGSYSTDSRLITKLLDKLPFYATKEKSNVLFKGEFAQIIPGHPKLLNDASDKNKGGVSYLDDFEASEVPYDLKLGNNWVMASTPGGFDKFPEANLSNDRDYNKNRAKLAWYAIDPMFFRNNSLTPDHIKVDKEMQSDHYMREVLETEVFPNKQLPNGVPGTLSTFDLSFWPNQRGPYNYNFDPKSVNADGTFTNPENRWAGIMRKIETNDFQAANIQYVEFWLMDPFLNKPNATGGDMYIHLGNISEDILKDGRKSWENGYPKTSLADGVDSTNWGRVPNGIQVTNSFDNDPAVRKYQDVGYDGLGPVGSDEDERSYFEKIYLDQLKTNFGQTSLAYVAANADPSNDNFHFYTGDDYDKAKANVIRRYKNFNNPEGNTPVATNGKTAGYGTSNPDDEDINHDFTLNTSEEYFEYKIPIKPADLQKVGQPGSYVTDILKAPVTLRNGKVVSATWYQFKVPIFNYSRKFGPIQDFKSIRFMRMLLTGFSDSVVCRFGQLQLVRAEWRKYLFNLTKPGEYIPSDALNTEFTVSSVSIEKNGHRQPPYVVPPGIQRTVDQTTPDQIQQNEQSLSMRVCNLDDGDARGVFKNTTFDIRQYKKMKMFVHAEAGDSRPLRDGEVNVFVRVGTDQNSNFYEYEMPLKITAKQARNKDDIWPAENEIEIALSDFYITKQQRQVANISLLSPFSRAASDGKGRVTVMGNPDLSNIKTIMVGVRNPRDASNPDGAKICAEVWVNELRVTDFDETGGWAGNLSMKTKLADLGTFSASISRRTIGFGSLEQTVQERSQKDTRSWDMAVSLELGKFFPKNWGLKIPMYYTYAETFSKPRYNPLSPDLPFDEVVNSYEGNPKAQDSVLNANRDYTARQSLNFTNVQKTRGPNKKLSLPLDIENFYVTYAYTEIFKRNIEKVYDIDRNYKAIIGYSYTFTSKPVQPFKKLGEKKGVSKYTQLISDFNFNYLPSSFSVSMEGDRKYGEILYRNTDNYKAIIRPMYDKRFKLDRRYDFRYNLTKSLKFNYGASASSRIPEPYGPIDNKPKRDSVWDSVRTFGKLTNFTQSSNLTYDVPISKIPFMDWTTLQTTYTGTYTWLSAPPATPTLGNTISNSRVLTGNLQLNFANLYSKIPYLKNIIQNKSNADRIKEQRMKALKEKRMKAGKDTINMKPPKVDVSAYRILDGALRILMSVRNSSISYSQNDGLALPGFIHTPRYLGMANTDDVRSNSSPGLEFVTGWLQDKDKFSEKARNNAWISTDTNVTGFFMSTHSTNISGQTTLEPLRNFRITVDFTKRESFTQTENLRFNGIDYQSYTPQGVGSYSISYLPIKTSFKPVDGNNSAFHQFDISRRTFAERLSAKNPNPLNHGIDDSTKYPLGYGKNNQDVLINAFVAAYTGKDPTKASLNPFVKLPMPNWRINYTGLNNLAFIQKVAKSITISHAYRSTYTIGNYLTTLGYDSLLTATSGQNLKPQYQIDNIGLSEDFSPLFGLDISWVNNWSTRMEYKKSRTLSFSYTNFQVSEIRSEEFVIGAGYRTNKLRLPNRGRKKMYLNNDFNFRVDFSIRDNRSVIHVLDENTSQPSSGQKIISFKPSVDYTISKSLLLKIFLTRNLTRPHVASQYPTSQLNFGFSLRYTLTPL